MHPLDFWIKELQELSIKKEVERAIKQLETLFITLQRNQLYNYGQNSTGDSLGDYSDRYANLRRRKGLRTDHVTLKFTGKFFASMRLTMKSDGIYIESKGVNYEQHIIKRYGIDIYDLNSTQRAKIIDEITAEMTRSIKERLQIR